MGKVELNELDAADAASADDGDAHVVVVLVKRL